jgi:hypothetical protein
VIQEISSPSLTFVIVISPFCHSNGHDVVLGRNQILQIVNFSNSDSENEGPIELPIDSSSTCQSFCFFFEFSLDWISELPFLILVISCCLVLLHPSAAQPFIANRVIALKGCTASLAASPLRASSIQIMMPLIQLIFHPVFAPSRIFAFSRHLTGLVHKPDQVGSHWQWWLWKVLTLEHVPRKGCLCKWTLKQWARRHSGCQVYHL